MMQAVIFFAMLGLTPAPARAEPAGAESRAGYEWARDNGIEEPQSCATESPDFNEGCLSFIAETAAQAAAAGQISESESEPEPEPAPESGSAPATDGLPAGYDFPDDQFTILE